jgi:hypothetical protein
MCVPSRSVMVVTAGIDEPREPTIKGLFAVSGNQCYFHYPDGRRCDEKLTDPSWKKVKAQVAHICADAEGGPRYDPNQTPEQRQAFENLMLLCPNHHTHVDHLRPDEYPPEVLRRMKATAEVNPREVRDWTDDATLERFARVALVVFRQDRGIYSADDDPDAMTSREGSGTGAINFAGRAEGVATPGESPDTFALDTAQLDDGRLAEPQPIISGAIGTNALGTQTLGGGRRVTGRGDATERPDTATAEADVPTPTVVAGSTGEIVTKGVPGRVEVPQAELHVDGVAPIAGSSETPAAGDDG